MILFVVWRFLYVGDLFPSKECIVMFDHSRPDCAHVFSSFAKSLQLASMNQDSNTSCAGCIKLTNQVFVFVPVFCKCFIIAMIPTLYMFSCSKVTFKVINKASVVYLIVVVFVDMFPLTEFHFAQVRFVYLI